MIYFDTETMGFMGPAVLIQWAEDLGPIHLHNAWRRPVGETLELIEKIVNSEVCGFNLAFDWFQLTKLYNMFRLVSNRSAVPVNYIEELAEIESAARFGALCLKPLGAVDLMLVARNTVYQNTMDRDPIVIRRVPSPLAGPLKEMLEAKVEIPGLYFAKRKKISNERWSVEDAKDYSGAVDPMFKNIVLRFAPSTALKVLAADALKSDVILHDDLEQTIGLVEDNHVIFGGNWPMLIESRAAYWDANATARQYASDDVKYTRELWQFFSEPKPDRDSALACAIGAIRWAGFHVNLDKLAELKAEAEQTMEGVARDPGRARAWLEEIMTPQQKLVLAKTDKQTLESIMEWGGEIGERAKKILRARQAFYNATYFDKILKCGRFHVSMKVGGTRTNRMAGDGGLNAQGLTGNKTIRSAFDLCDAGEELWGGDFDSFEPSIAATVYFDEGLMEDLKSGKKFHGIFGEVLFPDMTYEEIIESAKAENKRESAYMKAKTGSLAWTYMSSAPGLAKRLNLPEENVAAAGEDYLIKYPGVRAKQMEIANNFMALAQPGGIGTRIEWKEPADYVETILGFRRYFTLENQIIKALYGIAQNIPKEWQGIKLKVVRRDREQTMSGATSSALYSAAFGIQSATIRQAANCVVQSVGGELTKELQLDLWDVQPQGIHEFEIKFLNIHDEILAATRQGECTKGIVTAFLERRRGTIELLNMVWGRMQTWAG